MGTNKDESKRRPPKPIGKVVIEPHPEREEVQIEKMSDAQTLEDFIATLSEEERESLKGGLDVLYHGSDSAYMNLKRVPEAVIRQEKDRICKAYSNRKRGDVDAILADVEADMKNVTEAEFFNLLEQIEQDGVNIEFTNPDGTTEPLYDVTEETARAWLTARWEPFLFALSEWGKDTAPVTDRIDEIIEKWFNEPLQQKPREEEGKRKYRKREMRDGLADLIEKPDNRLETITHTDYRNALEFAPILKDRSKAGLQAIKPDKRAEIEFRNGNLFFAVNGRKVGEVELRNFQTNENIDEIDIDLLKVFYTFFLDGKRQNIDTSKMRVAVPDLFEFMYGLGKRNAPGTLYQRDENGNIVYDVDGEPIVTNLGFKDRIIEKMKEFHNIMGMMDVGQSQPSLYPPLIFQEYDAETDTIGFSSPYFEYLLKEASTNRKKFERQQGGRTITAEKPISTRLIRSEIATQKNKRAVRIVEIIVQTIESAGDAVHNPHISVKTIIDRNAQLRTALKNSNNVTRDLERAFSKAYELLETHTYLQEKYVDIRLPKAPADVPTAKTYRRMVLEFPHKGVRQDYQDAIKNAEKPTQK